jgi:poly(3-hydroxybutyrate) depolymerase
LLASSGSASGMQTLQACAIRGSDTLLMMYQAYQAFDDLAAPVRAMAGMAAWSFARGAESGNIHLRRLAATYELIARMRLTHERPAFGIDSLMVGKQIVEVREDSVYSTPFGRLLHFKKDVSTPQPRVLLVAPMSGHFATLLRATVETMLPEHDVYITDWYNARNISLLNGHFGFDNFIEHIIKFLEVIGPGAHALAVCQPGPAVLAAVAVMAESRNPATPQSLTLMAAPMDARINPSRVNTLANSHPIEWFERNLISMVPFRFPGAFRRVYPGFVQLTAFMCMNLQRHLKAQADLLNHRANGEDSKAQEIASFYDEYLAVMDLPAEFYLETVRLVFQEHALARGQLEWRGRRVDPGAIRRTALLTVEGERDDICSVGQTVAAHDLCCNLRPYQKRHHLQPGAGHYGVFSGSRWRNQVYPLVKNLILASD